MCFCITLAFATAAGDQIAVLWLIGECTDPVTEKYPAPVRCSTLPVSISKFKDSLCISSERDKT